MFQQKKLQATNGKKLSYNTNLLLVLQDRKGKEQENKGHTVLQLTLTYTPNKWSQLPRMFKAIYKAEHV